MAELRQHLIDSAQRMAAAGLNRGTAGNLSVRAGGGRAGFLITPTGMDYDALEAEDIVFMRLDGTPAGRRRPSSEWRFHRDLYAARPDAGAILHAHSPSPPASPACAATSRPFTT
jgi:L-fuculose-phosphate aldolase